MDSTAWDERYAARELVWSAGPNRILVDEVGDLTPGRALDVAAGEGRNAAWLAEQGWRVTAVDFSPVGVDKGHEIARARGVEIDWVVADATAWDPPQQAFDLVVVLYLQLPAAARRAAHERAAAALAPGGTFVILGHDRDNLDRGVGGPPSPEVLLTVDDVVGDLDGSGLAVDRAEQIERPVDTEDGQRTAIDTLVRARRPVNG